MKINSFKLEISPDASERHKEYLQQYWKYDLSNGLDTLKNINKIFIGSEDGFNNNDRIEFLKQFNFTMQYTCSLCNEIEITSEPLKTKTNAKDFSGNLKKYSGNFLSEIRQIKTCGENYYLYFHILNEQNNANQYIQRKYSDILCKTCILDFEQKINSRMEFEINNKNVLQKRNDEIDTKKAIEDKQLENEMLDSIINWTKLSKEELDFLKLIVLKDKKPQYIYYTLCNTTLERSFYTKFLKTFDELKLIKLIYNNKGYISKFTFLDKLKIELNKNESENSLNNHNNEIINNILSFSTSKNEYKKQINSPNYFNKFIPKNDIILKKGVEYSVGIWEQTDNSLNIKMSPSSEINNTINQKVTKEDIDILSSIIEKQQLNLNNEFGKLEINENESTLCSNPFGDK